ncbi:DnaB-like helicase C-terminal domain-containing protein [Streptomyces parvus]
MTLSSTRSPPGKRPDVRRPLGCTYEEISEIARKLKHLARELKIAIVAISKINRGPSDSPERACRSRSARALSSSGMNQLTVRRGRRWSPGCARRPCRAFAFRW